MKERILAGCQNIPIKNLCNYIRQGKVTLQELIDAGLADNKVQQIRDSMKEEDDDAWEQASTSDSLESYIKYLEHFTDGEHFAEARQKIDVFDGAKWSAIIANPSKESMEEYLSMFPNGIHVSECNDMLEDLPWLDAKRINTIAAYEDYQSKYPGKHTSEINDLIKGIRDDQDWENACHIGTSDAYKIYLQQHDNGIHASEAKTKIQASAGKDLFINDLKYDPNSHDAHEIQTKEANRVICWEDISEVFGEEKKEAIKKFSLPSPLPEKTPPPTLQGNSTEVYFWGTPSSGKTCALGSIISSAQSQGILEKISCSGLDYMTRLSNIFDAQGFCTFPDSTSVENIQEMILKLRDKKRKQHKLTLIDLAGELFRSAYFKQNKLFLESDKEGTLDVALNYLKDTRNEKIHFFVVEYGAHDNEWEGLKMVDYLDNMISFLKNENIFKKTTVGVYVLVTKCDKISCAVEDRPREAFEYVSKEMPSFWTNLEDTCKKANVGDLKVLSFSVGDVFAKNLCKFDATDTTKVIEKLITKTNAEGGFWDWLRH